MLKEPNTLLMILKMLTNLTELGILYIIIAVIKVNDSKRISDIIETITSQGSEIPYVDELQRTSEKIVRNDYSLEDSLNSLASNIKQLTEEFLHSKNDFGTSYVSGISSCIYLPDFSNNGEYKLKIIGGSKSRNIDLPIDEDTLFDVASITKVYTL